MISVEAVTAALDGVVDPELDRPLTSLGFVQDVRVRGADVRVELRLPTYWCSPSFAYLMVSDAHDAVSALAGAGAVRVELVEHCVAEAVTEGVSAGRSFHEAFPDHADGGLAQLRRTFRRKAFLVRQEPVLRAARRALGDEAAVAWPLGDGGAPPGVADDEWAEYIARRRALGIDERAGALAFTDADGDPIAADGLVRYLRLSRSVRISLMSNTEFCTGLLAARYDEDVERWQREEVAA